jgi:hypothetical protein
VQPFSEPDYVAGRAANVESGNDAKNFQDSNPR